MQQFIEILNKLKSYFLFLVIGFLLIVVYFKNNKIDKLNDTISDKPKIEYVYNTKIDTFTQTVVEVKNINKYVDRIILRVDSVEKELTNADSAQIAQAYIDLYKAYNDTNIYSDVLKDDSLAYVRLDEKVTQNSIFDRQFIYQDKTPIIYQATKVPVKLTSIVGGIEAGNNGVELGAGLITPKNVFYKVSYDPFNKGAKGAVYLPIFNFKR